MQSPFKIFRRFQKALLAFLAVMAMIAFGVGDQLLKMTRSAGSSNAAQPVVETSAGNLTRNGLRDLMRRRHTANIFLYKAVIAAHPEYENIARFIPNLVPNFGSEAPREVVFSWLMQHEAKRLGIVVDDPQIKEFIQQSTDRKLKLEQFTLILKSMQISAKELYEVLRDELQGQTAFKMTVPVAAQSPEQYWKYYRQLHTRQKIEVAPLPIRDFVASIPNPSASVLEKFFEANKSRLEASVDGERKPGFRQPPKVKLHVLQLADLDIEEQIQRDSPVTDKDIADYYESKKLIDRRLQIFESNPALDGENSPIGPEFAPNEKRPDPPALPIDEPSGAPGADQSGQAAPAAQSADESDGASDLKTAGKRADEKSSLSSDALKTPGKAPVREIKFKPLDDILRGEIRDSILHERTQKRMKETASKIAEALRDVGLKFAQQNEFDLARPKPAQMARLVERSRRELEAIAAKFGTKFSETGLVNPRELSELSGIGKAQEPDANELSPNDVRNVVNMAFDGETLCRVFEAEASAAGSGALRDRYVFWKVQDVPAHVPTFDEPGVKDQVLEAWKLQQAIPAAKKRADELSLLIRNSKEQMSTVLAGQTVTGEASALSLTVQESPEFSWWRESLVPGASMRQQPVQLSNPVVVNAAGMKFMEYVFDDLKEGDVGVTLNDDASVCYIVKVVSRRPADRESFKNAPLFGSSPGLQPQGSPYQQLAQLEQRGAIGQFFQQIEKAYAVKWRESDSTDEGAPFEGE